MKKNKKNSMAHRPAVHPQMRTRTNAWRNVGMSALGVTGVMAATVLTGGVYATSVAQVNDISNFVVGNAEAARSCDTAFTVKTGLARFDEATQNFLIQDVTVSEVAPECAGLLVTLAGTDVDGVPVVESSGVASAGTFVLNLSNYIGVDSVANWNIVMQAVAGDVVSEVTPPLFTTPTITVEAEGLVPTPLPTPTSTPTPSPSSSLADEEDILVTPPLPLISEPDVTETATPTTTPSPSPTAG